MTRKDITTELLNDWIDDAREQFKDEPDSMNLINICIKNLDKSTTEKTKKKFLKSLKEFYENELTHKGELFCEKCGNQMEVYYTSKCFKCTKPKIDKKGRGNYFEAINYVEANEEDFDSDKFWDELMDYDVVQGNDTWCELPKLNSKNFKLFNKHFDVTNILWFVSW